jgi:hypothetical protein
MGGSNHDGKHKSSRQHGSVEKALAIHVDASPSCETLKANRRISNIEPQNVEVWNRFAQSFLK